MTRGLKTLARGSWGFLTASWDGRYKHPNNQTASNAGEDSEVGSSQVQKIQLPSPQVNHEKSSYLRISVPPIAFMRPDRFSGEAAASLRRRMPEFDARAREQAALASVAANQSDSDISDLAQQKLALQLEELLAEKCHEFSDRLERRLESFYDQTASRLDVLSNEIVHQFCETLNQQMTEALNDLLADRVGQNRALIEAECHAALDRFGARLEKIALSHLEGHRKEIQVLSINLKTRLRGVAHALEELGPRYRA